MAVNVEIDGWLQTHLTLFHIGTGNAKFPDNGVNFLEIFFGFCSRGKIGLADNFDQGNAGAVEVDQGDFS